MFAFVGIPGLIIILVILLILYGPKRVPRTARALRKSAGQFKSEITKKDDTLPELPPASAQAEQGAAVKRDTVV